MGKLSLPLLLDTNFHALSGEYNEFAREKDSCRLCGVYDHYKQVVQSEGNAKNPTFMFIGEAPGAEEAETGRPFIGRAGQRLRASLKRHKTVFNKKTTLISNVIACRPPKNKFPDGNEAKFCCDMWLKREIEIVQPDVIVLLGNQSLKYVSDRTGITRLRGQFEWSDEYNAAIFATYHPSYVMRCENGMKKEVGTEFEQDIDTLAEEGRRRLQV
jgi:uracil-DNA glycosylase family 4